MLVFSRPFPPAGETPVSNFITELKRRNVFKVGVAYIVVSWVTLQLVDVIQEPLALPLWFSKVVIVLLAVGLPIALVISWAFELTPEGLVKDSAVNKEATPSKGSGQGLNRLIIGGLLVAVIFLLVDRFFLEKPAPEPAAPSTQTHTADQTVSIAVLPFLNLSGDASQDYFSEGVSEEILDALVKVDGLSVASRTSAFAFKGENLNIPEIAKDLKVSYVIEGSVRRSGDTVRITAQLIDGRSDRHLWSNSYDRQMTDIFKVQDDIAHNIVAELGKTLGLKSLKAAPVEQKTENMSAYDAYLKGRNLFLSRTDLANSAKYLEQAVALDDSFAAAWESLAAVYSVLPSWGFGDRPYIDLSNQAADKAIALGSQSMAWAVKGSNMSFSAFQEKGGEPDWDGSFVALNRAIENDPKNATAYLWRGLNLLYLGYLDKAMDDIQRCLEVDPAYGNCKRYETIILTSRGHYAKALQSYQEVTEDGFPVVASEGLMPAAMVMSGNELAAVMFWRALLDDSFPVRLWIDAVKNPAADHSEGLAILRKWAQDQGQKLDSVPIAIPLAFEDYQEIRTGFGIALWAPLARGYRQSKYFKQMAREKNYLSYWRENGFPAECHAVGDDDFECQ